MQILELDKNQHDRRNFDCGNKALNDYLKIMANQNAKNDNARTYILEHQQYPNQIIGFYTLSMTIIDLNGLPQKLQKKHPLSLAAGLIARLAIDKRYQGKRLGEVLLIDALKRLLKVSDQVGFPLVIVDAKDGAQAFYAKYGFTPFQDLEGKFFMTIADIRLHQ